MNTFIDDINDVLEQWASKIVAEIKSNLDSTGTTASGRTKESIEYTVDNGTLVITGRPYFRSVEEGRGPGGIPYGFTDIIRQWMRDKNIESKFGETESQRRSAAYLIGQFIKRNGSSLYRNGGRDDIYSSVISDEMPKLNGMLTAAITETIVRDLPK